MTYREYCPICGGLLMGKDVYEEPAGLVESCWACEACALVKEFSYGVSRWALGRLEWIWGWADTWEDVRPMHDEFYGLCNQLRSEYRAMQEGQCLSA